MNKSYTRLELSDDMHLGRARSQLYIFMGASVLIEGAIFLISGALSKRSGTITLPRSVQIFCVNKNNSQIAGNGAFQALKIACKYSLLSYIEITNLQTSPMEWIHFTILLN